MIFNLHISFT